MNIIIDGPDNVGKTTWAERLRKITGYGYFHPPKSQEPYATFYDQHKGIYRMSQMLDLTVIDRSLVSEFAYNRDRPPEMLDDLRFCSKKTLIFICTHSWELCVETANQHADQEISIEGVGSGDRNHWLQFFKMVNDRYLEAYKYLKSIDVPNVYHDSVHDREEAYIGIEARVRVESL